MKKKENWFTGIDYYDNYFEKDIKVEKTTITENIDLKIHKLVELWYVCDGEGTININGINYPLEKDTFLCLYPYHIYSVDVVKPIKVYTIKFYIGLFMHTMWEKHDKGVNYQLVHETEPYQKCSVPYIKNRFEYILSEYNSNKFGSENIILYAVLEVYTLFCRNSLELYGDYNSFNSHLKSEDKLWNHIKDAILYQGNKSSLDDIAEDLDLNPSYINQLIKKKSGYTFKELKDFGTIVNACSLLHFEDLSISYITELLGFKNVPSFYRVFEKYIGKSPIEYREDNIVDNKRFFAMKDLYLKVIQYIYLHFYKDITVEDVANELHIKTYTINSILEEYYFTSFAEELEKVRLRLSYTLLKITKLTILQISCECGFKSLSTFQRTFVKYNGISPTEYRNIKK